MEDRQRFLRESKGQDRWIRRKPRPMTEQRRAWATQEEDAMEQEYSFTLTVPQAAVDQAITLLEQARREYPRMRISRKPDYRDSARIYLSFPFSGARPDLKFQEWFNARMAGDWELFGPTYGRWGLT